MESHHPSDQPSGNSPRSKPHFALANRGDDSDLLRLFIAVTLPPAAIHSLEFVQARLRQVDSDRLMNWAGSEGFHVTLKFLGETAEERLTEIDEGLTDAATSVSAFHLNAFGIGCFPNPTFPQAIWAGIQGEVAPLERLQHAVETRIAPIGFPIEKRAFHPHLTFGRLRPTVSRIKAEILGRKLSALEIGEITAWGVTSVHLIQSELKPSGAIYTVLATYPFPASSTQK